MGTIQVQNTWAIPTIETILNTLYSEVIKLENKKSLRTVSFKTENPFLFSE